MELILPVQTPDPTSNFEVGVKGGQGLMGHMMQTNLEPCSNRFHNHWQNKFRQLSGGRFFFCCGGSALQLGLLPLGLLPLGLLPLGLLPLGLSPPGLLPPSGSRSSGRGRWVAGLWVVGLRSWVAGS